MKVQVSKAERQVLDWMVAKAEGWEINHHAEGGWFLSNDVETMPDETLPEYSTNWEFGGPIIEREGMHIDCLRQADHYRTAVWEAWPYSTGTKHIHQATTPLIAAMRCYVLSKLGDEVDVPEELT